MLKEIGLHIIFKINENMPTLSHILMDAEPTIRKECYSTGRLRWAGRTTWLLEKNIQNSILGLQVVENQKYSGHAFLFTY